VDSQWLLIRSDPRTVSPANLASRHVSTKTVFKIGAVGAVLAGAFVATIGLTLEFALLIGISIVILVAIIARGLSHRLDVLEPLPTFALAWAVMFVVRPIAMLFEGDVRLRGQYDVSDALAMALFLALIGAVAFVAGYLLPRRSVAVARASDLPNPRGAAPLAIGAVTGAIALTAILLTFGQPLAGPSAYLYYLPLLAVPASVLLLQHLTVLGAGGALLAGLPALLLAASYWGVGQRAFILMPLGALFVLHYLRRGRQLSRPVWAAAATVGFVVVVVLVIVRAEPETDRTTVFIESVTRPVDTLGSFVLGGSTEMAPALALQVATEGQLWTISPGYFAQSLGVHWIPRVAWPEKPLSSAELLYSRFFPAHYAASRANVQFSILGDLYYDSGVVGVVAGMLLLGLAVRKFYEWLRRNETDPYAQMLYAPFLPVFVILLRGDAALTVGIAAFLYGPLFAVALLRTFVSHAPPAATRVHA
jgi:hypothetical protein